MKLHYTLCLSALLTGCANTESKPAEESLPPELEALAWVKNANAVKDAENAISNGIFKLKAIGGRGLMLPGIEGSRREMARQKCGIEYMKGMGDVMKSKEHRQWWQKGKEYAKTYNMLVVKHCL